MPEVAPYSPMCQLALPSSTGERRSLWPMHRAGARGHSRAGERRMRVRLRRAIRWVGSRNRRRGRFLPHRAMRRPDRQRHRQAGRPCRFRLRCNRKVRERGRPWGGLGRSGLPCGPGATWFRRLCTVGRRPNVTSEDRQALWSAARANAVRRPRPGTSTPAFGAASAGRPAAEATSTLPSSWGTAWASSLPRTVMSLARPGLRTGCGRMRSGRRHVRQTGALRAQVAPVRRERGYGGLQCGHAMRRHARARLVGIPLHPAGWR